MVRGRLTAKVLTAKIDRFSVPPNLKSNCKRERSPRPAVPVRVERLAVRWQVVPEPLAELEVEVPGPRGVNDLGLGDLPVRVLIRDAQDHLQLRGIRLLAVAAWSRYPDVLSAGPELSQTLHLR